jgi:triacylglycerol lipase
VTLSRKAIQGGTGVGSDGAYDLGPALTRDVDAFVGIAGANRGLTSAYLFPIAPTTNALDGFYPGLPTPFGVMGQSRFLQDINREAHDEGARVYSIWSPADEIVNAGAPLGGGRVYGEPTSRIPGQDGEKVYAFKGHFQLKDDSVEDQLWMVRGGKK